MTVGTKSVLFGVHAFWWHPLTVALAWRRLYGRWPAFVEWIAIFCHDLGYFGKPNIDGVEGKKHPEFGAWLAWSTVYDLCGGSKADYVYRLCLYHSKHYAGKDRQPTSRLFLPDKLCIKCEPQWWYLLRARLSGEIKEYMRNAPAVFKSDRAWYAWYLRSKVQPLVPK